MDAIDRRERLDAVESISVGPSCGPGGPSLGPPWAMGGPSLGPTWIHGGNAQSHILPGQPACLPACAHIVVFSTTFTSQQEARATHATHTAGKPQFLKSENICLSQTCFFQVWQIYVCHRRVFSRFGKYMSVTDVFFPSLANICLSQTCFFQVWQIYVCHRRVFSCCLFKRFHSGPRIAGSILDLDQLW
jgi:hypothetical protein